MGMEQEDKWTRFAATGRIQDYLDYRQVENATNAGERSTYGSSEVGQSDFLRQEKQDGNGIIW
ncbi:MAG: hypothetical protein J5979_05900 [Lachnospiraceae bacterium]|nr:hypothetical protein [Lachnospiraceae bacterium]